MNIKTMKKEMYEAVALIEKECFSDAWSVDSLASTCEHSYAVVCEDNDIVCGYIIATTDGDFSSIDRIAVSPLMRNKGYASALMESFISHCRDNSWYSLSLEVRESNISAISLYRKFGFKKAGIRKHLYTMPDEDAVVMICELQGE